MVLELKPPEHFPFAALALLWPTALSYLFIAIIWVNHHYLLRIAEGRQHSSSGGTSLTCLWCL
jgi:uncharacterized membrane protein